LRRYRVLNDCQACRRHYAISLNEWNRRRDEEIEERAAELESNPYDSEKGLALARACASYRDGESFQEHAEAIEAALGQDPDGLAYLGSAHELFSEPSKSRAPVSQVLRSSAGRERSFDAGSPSHPAGTPN
jgi:hypothetical protein